jgi:predicted phosphoribosyltransferase
MRRDGGLLNNCYHLNDLRRVVLALSAGGVPVGLEMVIALAAPVDVVLMRKVGAPYQAELVIGAIADGEDLELVTAPALVAAPDVSSECLDDAHNLLLQLLERTLLGDRDGQQEFVRVTPPRSVVESSEHRDTGGDAVIQLTPMSRSGRRP